MYMHLHARPPSLPPSVSSRLSSPIRTPFSSTSSFAPTITPSLFTRNNPQAVATTLTTRLTYPSHDIASFLASRERSQVILHSRKDGKGVHEVSEYIARRVVTRWEYEEAIDARTPSNGNDDSKDHRLKITFSSGNQRETPGTNRLASHVWAGEETVLFESDKDGGDTLDFVNAALNL